MYAVSMLVKIRVFLFSSFRSSFVSSVTNIKPSLLLEKPPVSRIACSKLTVVSAPCKVSPVGSNVDLSTGSLKYMVSNPVLTLKVNDVTLGGTTSKP